MTLESRLKEGVNDVKQARHPKLQAAVAALGYGTSLVRAHAAYGMLTGSDQMKTLFNQLYGPNAVEMEIIENSLWSIGAFLIASWFAYYLVKRYVL